MKNLFLVGYMGSGKSSLGKQFAADLGYEFIDLDFYIQQRFRHTVTEIFHEYGEERFREMEREMLREVGEMEGKVIACGGGTPCFFDNMEYMNSRGTTLFLDATEEYLFHYLKRGKSRRPLIASMTDEELRSYLSRHLAERRPWYSQARYRVRLTRY